MSASSTQPTGSGSESRALDTSQYLVRTSSLPESSFQRSYHHIATDRFLDFVSLGDLTGLTKIGMHICRLTPGMTSMALHWHESTDEWVYILSGGDGGVVQLLWERGDEKSREEIVPKEVAVKDGDFLGFRAGLELAHALKAGTTELVYLVGGERLSGAPRGTADVCHYPMEGKRLDEFVDDATGKVVEETRDEDIFVLTK